MSQAHGIHRQFPQQQHLTQPTGEGRPWLSLGRTALQMRQVPKGCQVPAGHSRSFSSPIPTFFQPCRPLDCWVWFSVLSYDTLTTMSLCAQNWTLLGQAKHGTTTALGLAQQVRQHRRIPRRNTQQKQNQKHRLKEEKGVKSKALTAGTVSKCGSEHSPSDGIEKTSGTL